MSTSADSIVQVLKDVLEKESQRMEVERNERKEERQRADAALERVDTALERVDAERCEKARLEKELQCAEGREKHVRELCDFQVQAARNEAESIKREAQAQCAAKVEEILKEKESLKNDLTRIQIIFDTNNNNNIRQQNGQGKKRKCSREDESDDDDDDRDDHDDDRDVGADAEPGEVVVVAARGRRPSKRSRRSNASENGEDGSNSPHSSTSSKSDGHIIGTAHKTAVQVTSSQHINFRSRIGNTSMVEAVDARRNQMRNKVELTATAPADFKDAFERNAIAPEQDVTWYVSDANEEVATARLVTLPVCFPLSSSRSNLNSSSDEGNADDSGDNNSSARGAAADVGRISDGYRFSHTFYYDRERRRLPWTSSQDIPSTDEGKQQAVFTVRVEGARKTNGATTYRRYVLSVFQGGIETFSAPARALLERGMVDDA